jgi:signal transduction histidine kinase/ActR/RegA family two-component response regulator
MEFLKYLRNDADSEIKLPVILSCYKDSDFETRIKVKFILVLCIMMIVFIVPAMAYTVWVHLSYFHDPSMLVPVLAGEFVGMILLFFSLFLLTKGHHQASSHLIIASSILAIWLVMIVDRSTIIIRLDTATYILAVLALMPAFFVKKRYIPMYSAANVIFLWSYIYFSMGFDYDTTDYFADYTVAIIFISIVGYNIARINRTLLDKYKSEIENHRLAKEALAVEKEKLLEAQKLIESAAQTQKLQSLGILAGGIAHDFNNLLTGIFGYIGFARDESKENNIKELLNEAAAAINRAKSLTHQLLTFSKGGVPIKKLQALSPFIEESVRFALSGSSVIPVFNIPDDLKMAEFDRNQVAQVIDNIVLNAVEAMSKSGKIKISAQNIFLKENELFPLGEREYIKISITDEGPGIPEESLPHIFDPFFTTKREGQGLGLAMSYSIIKKHNGLITVDSEAGNGATFNVFIPAVDKTLQHTGHEPEIVKNICSFSGKILIMDDEMIVSQIVAKIVSSLGFEPVTVSNGQHAIEKFVKAKNEATPFKALIFDLTIPDGMGGQETIKKIRAIDKNVVAFVSTGYSEDPVVADPAAYGFNDSISKPFEIDELKEKLGKYL